MRRNADAAPMADALRARGLSVEVVGLSGLLDVDEVADVVAMLRMAADPTARAGRRPGAHRAALATRRSDLAALWRRASPLADGPGATAGSAGGGRRGRPDADHRLPGRRAVCDPGPAAACSETDTPASALSPTS